MKTRSLKNYVTKNAVNKALKEYFGGCDTHEVAEDTFIISFPNSVSKPSKTVWEFDTLQSDSFLELKTRSGIKYFSVADLNKINN